MRRPQVMQLLLINGALPMANECHIEVRSAGDVVKARQRGRELAMELGFVGSDLTCIATAISEVARNIVTHAKCGEVTLSATHQASKRGICIVAEGLGIADPNQEMEYGFSTHNGTGVGLLSAKWLMDDFQVRSKTGKG